MEVHVNQVSSTVRTTESGTSVDEIVRLVLARIREQQAYERRVAEERRLRPAVSAEEGSAWE